MAAKEKQARYDEAESLLIEAVEGRRLKLGDKRPHTQEFLNHLIELYEAWDKPEKAEEWRAKLPDVQGQLGPEDSRQKTVDRL